MNTKMKKTGYDISKDIINKIYEMKNKSLLREEEENNNKKERKPIAITNAAKFGNQVLQGQIDAFREAVDGGAKFSKENENEPENNPLIYYPEKNNLVFSGSIPNLSDLKFQFSLNDVTASPYIFADGLALTENVVSTLNKLRGYYLNWRDEWNSQTDLLDKLSKQKES